jgi:hypothetical protein
MSDLPLSDQLAMARHEGAQAALRVVRRYLENYRSLHNNVAVYLEDCIVHASADNDDVVLVQTALVPGVVDEDTDLAARTLWVSMTSNDGVDMADVAPLGSWRERALWTRLSDEGKAYWRARAQAVVDAAAQPAETAPPSSLVEPPAVAAETARRSKGTYAANSRSTKVLTLLRRSQRDAKGVAKALGCSLRQARSSLDQLIRQGRIEPGKYRGTYRVAAK